MCSLSRISGMGLLAVCTLPFYSRRSEVVYQTTGFWPGFPLGGSVTQPCPQGYSLPGGELEDGATGGGEGQVPLRGTVSPRGAKGNRMQFAGSKEGGWVYTKLDAGVQIDRKSVV